MHHNDVFPDDPLHNPWNKYNQNSNINYWVHTWKKTIRPINQIPPPIDEMTGYLIEPKPNISRNSG